MLKGYSVAFSARQAIAAEGGREEISAADLEAVRYRARSHRRFAPPTHPLYTRFANIFGASVSEAAVRPDPQVRMNIRSSGLKEALAR